MRIARGIRLELVKAFEEKYPDIQVEAINIPEKYWDKLLTMFAGGTAPDVVYMNYMNLAGFADKGVLEDLMPWIEKSPDFNLPDFFPSLIKQVRYKAGLYELPKDFTTSVIYYNKDMLKEAGLKFPDANWTWDDFRNAAKALTKDKDGAGRIDQYGWDGLFDTSLNTYWIRQNGGEIIDSDGKAVLDSPQNIEAYQLDVDIRSRLRAAQCGSLEGIPHQGAVVAVLRDLGAPGHGHHEPVGSGRRDADLPCGSAGHPDGAL